MSWRWPRIAVVYLAPIAAVGILDHLTGPDFGLSVLYLTPVVLAGWREGKRAGLLAALGASASWAWAAAATGESDPLATAWNSLTRVFIYVAMGVGAAMMRADRERLRELIQREQELARTDPITGLGNRRAFDEYVKTDLARARRDQKPLSLVLFDLDNFKRVNDLHGHSAGDRVLAEVAASLRATLREGDRAARIGGDEFAALLWGADARSAEGVAERLVRAVASLGERYPGSGLGASVGIADAGQADGQSLFDAADSALYRVKSAGKGAVERA